MTKIFEIKIFSKKGEAYPTSPSTNIPINPSFIVSSVLKIEVSSTKDIILANDTGIFRTTLLEIELPTLVRKGQILGIIEPIYFGGLVKPSLIKAKVGGIEKEGILAEYEVPKHFSCYTPCYCDYLKNTGESKSNFSIQHYTINKGSWYVRKDQAVITFYEYNWTHDEKLEKLFPQTH